MATANRRSLFATTLHGPVPEVRFTFDGDTTELTAGTGSVGRSNYSVTWSGKPFAQVWLAAQPMFEAAQDVFLGFHPLETASAAMAAQFIADALQREITVEGREVQPRPLKDFLSRRLFLTDADYKKAIAKVERLQRS